MWSARLVVYSAAVFVSFTYIAPIGEYGVYLAGPLASIAIIGDLLLSARFKGTDVASEVATRMAIADRVLGDRGERTLESGNEPDQIKPGQTEDTDPSKRLGPGQDRQPPQ